MKKLLTLLFVIVGLATVNADEPPPVAGIIILKAVAGYDAAAVAFVSIQWTTYDGGYVTDSAGKKTPFLNNAIGRIIYFDQAFYEEVDHNQNWSSPRAGIQNREIVALPVDTLGLSKEDIGHLKQEQSILEDAVQRYPSGHALVDPIINLIKDDVSKLSNGQALQNGKWISASDVVQASTPVVGNGGESVTFTTKDGRKFINARVMLSGAGISVLTSDGGASLTYDQMPDDLSQFPPAVRNKVQAEQQKLKAAADAAAATTAAASQSSTPVEAGPAPAKGFLGMVEDFLSDMVHKATAYFFPGKSSETSANSGAASTASTLASPAPASATPASPAPASTNAAAKPAPAVAPPLDPNSVVLIKGDNAEGTGFLTKTADGPVVITNLHVIAANPNFKILTASGAEITPLSLKGAADRDLAVFAIKDANYTYLELAANVDKAAAPGDAMTVPGDSEGGEVTLKTDGKLVGIGPQRVEFSNPIYHGNSGGPVYDNRTGKVVAVVVGATEMKPTDEVDRSSFANANSAIKGPMRYFGLRYDTVPGWDVYDMSAFESETLLLKSFHEETRALDSFLNGAGYEKKSWAQAEGPPDSKYYLTNDKVKAAEDTYNRTLQQHDKKTALQELAWSLGTLTDDNIGSVQDPRRFFPYNQDRAKYELKYRMALKGEIQKIQDMVNSMGTTSGQNFGL